MLKIGVLHSNILKSTTFEYLQTLYFIIISIKYRIHRYLLVEYYHHTGLETGVTGERALLTWPPLNADWRALFHQGFYFKRELDACPDNSLNYFPSLSRRINSTMN